MDEKLLLVAFLGFFSGYIFKTLAFRNHTSTEASSFVTKVATECLLLIGTVVYKLSYLDQLYIKAVEDSQGIEDAKVMKNQLSDNFQDWKKKIISDFSDSYPEDFKWHLENDDWNGAMKLLDDIYNEKKV